MPKIIGVPGIITVLLTTLALLPAGAEAADPVDAVCGTVDALGCETYYTDADGDGYGDPATAQRSPVRPDGKITTGGDCDDTDANVHPGALESYDGRDEDCDGEVDEVVLVVSELMANPDAVSDTNGEYVEVANTSPEAVDLTGLVLEAGGRSCELAGVLQGGERLVAARDADPQTNGGFLPDVACTIQLQNSGTLVQLVAPVGVIDAVDATGWTFPTGASLSLAPEAHDPASNDAEASWCAATSPYGDGDLGTPGTANDPCA